MYLASRGHNFKLGDLVHVMPDPCPSIQFPEGRSEECFAVVVSRFSCGPNAIIGCEEDYKVATFDGRLFTVNVEKIKPFDKQRLTRTVEYSTGIIEETLLRLREKF